MDLHLTDDQRLLRQSVREFAERELRPHVAAWDEAQQFPMTLLPALVAVFEYLWPLKRKPLSEEEARAVMIDHARIAGTEVTSDGEAVSSEPERLRLRTDVAAGATKDIRVTETRADAEAVHLSDAPADTLLFYASTRGADPAIVEKLKAIAAIKTRVADAERAIERAERTVARQAEEQERIRANLAALPETSDSAKSYIAKLARSEKAIEEAEAERVAEQAKADRERQALDTAIAAF